MGEGQVHQTHPEEGIKIREQIRQTAREGSQVCLRQPAEAVQVIPTQQLFDFHIKNVVWTIQNYCTVLYITVIYSRVEYFKALTTAGLAKKVGLGLKVWKASKLLESEPSEQVRAFRGKRSPSLMGGLLNLALNIASPVGGGGALNVFNPFMVFNPFRTLPLLKLPLLKLPLLLKLKKKIGLLALLKLLGFKREKVPEKKCWQVPVQKCEKVPVKKCHKEQKCRTVPHKQCKKVPRQACWTVNKQQCRLVPRQECTQVPQEHCTQVPHEKCWDEPRETCRQVPQEACWDEPRQSCHKVPRQECTQVPHQKCSQVPHETCKQVPEEKCWDEPKRTCWTEPHQKCWEEPRKKCGTINMKVARRVCH